MDRIADLFGRIAELTPEELAELDGLLEAEFDRLEGEPLTPEIVAQMEEIGAQITRVRETAAAQAEAQAQAEARAAELRSQIKAVDNPEDGAADPEVEGDAPAAEDETPAPEAEAEEETPAAVAASAKVIPPRPSIASMNARRRTNPADNRLPDGPVEGRARQTVKAQRTFTGVSNGDDISTWDALNRGMTEAVQRLGRGTGEEVLVATAVTEYPEARRLTGDPVNDTRKIDDVVDGVTRGIRDSLVASGGICNPVNVDYTIPVFADDDEPIKAGLPSFQADRGGLRFVQPPSLASVGGAGTALWTQATDAGSPGNGLTKPVQTFTCGSEVEVYVDAIATRMRFGNMMSKFSPEIVAANTKLALANAARIREEHRLTQIASYSTIVSSAQLLGAARDFLATLDLAQEAYRYRQRLPRNTQLRVILPYFVIGMFRADFTRELSNGNEQTMMSLSDADITRLITDRGVTPIWTLDDTPIPGSGTITYGLQGFGTQAAQSALVDWPTKVTWFMFAEGTFQFLDGGMLNLGVVRDSALDASNNYETFVEVFESIAKRGVESLQIVSSLRPNGASAAGIVTAANPVVY